MEDGIKVKELLNKEENKKIAIIGAGFIGLEAVEAAKRLGKEVRVFQSGERVLAQVFDNRGRPGFRGTLWVASRVPSALSTSNS